MNKIIIPIFFLLILSEWGCRKCEQLPPPPPPCDPGQVCLISPEYYAANVSRLPLLVWSKYGNIEQYQVELTFWDTNYLNEATLRYMVDSIVNDTQFYYNGFYTAQANYHALNSNHDYFWRVRGIANPGDTTLWSDSYKFSTVDIRDSIIGTYSVDKYNWRVNPNAEYLTGDHYTASVTKGNGSRNIFVDIEADGVHYEMVQPEGSEDAYRFLNVYDESYRPEVYFLFPAADFKLHIATWGFNPPYYHGGIGYIGMKN